MTSAHHDPDRRFRLDVLATLVQEELAAAGLPVVPGEQPVGLAGATVHVDLPDLRGVLVDWREHTADWQARHVAECPNHGDQAIGDR
jgi:hypothetical protein